MPDEPRIRPRTGHLAQLDSAIDERLPSGKAARSEQRATAVFGGSGGGSSSGAPVTTSATRIDQAGGTGTPTYGALAGAINGSNKVFTASAGYYTSGTVMVWLNGVLVAQGTGSNEWSETSPAAGTVTFGTAPQSGDWILMQYGV